VDIQNSQHIKGPVYKPLNAVRQHTHIKHETITQKVNTTQHSIRFRSTLLIT